jgi:hypothetical protein
VPPSSKTVRPMKMDAESKSNQRILCGRGKGWILCARRNGCGIRKRARWSYDKSIAFESRANALGCRNFNTILRPWRWAVDLQ